MSRWTRSLLVALISLLAVYLCEARVPDRDQSIQRSRNAVAPTHPLP
jgi:hypothetical protein